MLDSFLHNMGLYNLFYDEDYNLIEIKNKLKHTVTLKRRFFAPTELEIINKYHMIKNKSRPKINVSDLINAKKNLVHTN